MMLAAASDLARQVDRTFWLIGLVTLALLLGITVAMVAFAIRYRRSRRATVSQVHGHTALEVAWIVLPTLLVCWMFTVGVDPFQRQRAVPPDARVIQVTGRQWAWSFHYPQANIDASELVVPVNVPIKLELHSNDVIHGFYIPDFRVKEDVVPKPPGFPDNYMWFQADRIGEYHVFCSQFCGKDHSQMHTLLRVKSAGDYDAWLNDQIARKYRPLILAAVTQPDLPAFGPADLNIDRKAVFKTFCATCHGENGDGSGLPRLARNFTSPAGWKRSPKVADIFRTLSEGVPDSQMRPFPNLTPWEKVALAHQVRSFLKGAAPPMDTQADYDALVKDYGLDKLTPPPTPLPIERAMQLLVQEKGKLPPATAPGSRPP